MIPIEDIKKKYGTEVALVLLCCRLHFKTEDTATLHQYIKNYPVDWDRAFHLSAYHRIEPVVLKELEPAIADEKIAQKIKQKRLFLIHQNFKQALETERVISLLATEGIHCVPYKGVAFSRQFYGDIVSRESSDIDLVIQADHFSKVISIMKNDGYIFENQIEYNYYQEDIFKKFNSLNFDKFNKDLREFHIEFHWRITENFVQTQDQAHQLLFNNSDTVLLAKQKVKALNPTAHFMAMFIHHANHDGFKVLRNLVDIGQIIQKENVGSGINIAEVKKYLSRFRLAKAANTCVILTEKLLGISLPISTENKIPVPSNLDAFFTNRLMAKEITKKSISGKLDLRAQLLLKDSLLEKTKFTLACVQQFFTPSYKDLSVFNLPKRLHFLYYFLKPFRGVFNPINIKDEQIKRRQKIEE